MAKRNNKVNGHSAGSREWFRNRKEYAFTNEAIDVGLGIYGPTSMFGPLVLTALFLPSSKHQTTLYRYDLMYQGYHDKQSLRESQSYTKILSLNYTELGFLVKSIGPEQVSNMILSEGHDAANY